MEFSTELKIIDGQLHMTSKENIDNSTITLVANNFSEDDLRNLVKDFNTILNVAVNKKDIVTYKKTVPSGIRVRLNGKY